MQHVAELVASAGRNLVVLSAMSGTTNTLVEIAGYLYNHNSEGARDTISRLEGKYLKVIKELYSTEEYAAKARDYVHELFAFLGRSGTPSMKRNASMCGSARASTFFALSRRI